MKTRTKLLMAGLLLIASSSSYAWFGNNGWGNNGWNNWPVWTPMYWAEEVFDDNDRYGYPGYGYGGYPGYGYGGYPGAGYGGYPSYGYGGYPGAGYGGYPSYGYGGYPGSGYGGYPGGWGW